MWLTCAISLICPSAIKVTICLSFFMTIGKFKSYITSVFDCFIESIINLASLKSGILRGNRGNTFYNWKY